METPTPNGPIPKETCAPARPATSRVEIGASSTASHRTGMRPGPHVGFIAQSFILPRSGTGRNTRGPRIVRDDHSPADTSAQLSGPAGPRRLPVILRSTALRLDDEPGRDGAGMTAVHGGRSGQDRPDRV